MATHTKQPKKTHYPRLPRKDREHVLADIALLLKAGVSVGETMQTLQESSHSKPLRQTLGAIKTDIDEGSSLWKALARTKLATPQALALIQLGEQSGNLVNNMELAAAQEEKQRAFRSKVMSALLYPSFVMTITCVIGLGVAWFLLPRLSQTFVNLNVELPLISRIFMNLGTFLQHNGLWAIPAFIASLGILFYLIFGTPFARPFGQAILFHIPGVGKLLREVEIARFGYLFGTLLKAGIPIAQSLLLLEQATRTVRYKKLYANLRTSLEDGYSLRVSMPKYASDKVLPASVRQMVIAGERSGALPEALTTIGSTYESKSDSSAQNLETILEPLLLVLVWLGVLGVAIAVILPVYSLVNGLGGQ